MKLNNDIYVIAGDEHQIWAINPATKQRLQIKLGADKSKVLDIYVSGSGIYHASEIVTWQSKEGEGYTQSFKVNYAQVNDSISGRSCVTITPPGTESLPLEKRLVPLNFQFVAREESLHYNLNNFEGIVFSHFNRGVEQLSRVNFEGKNVYFGDKKIVSLEEGVLYAKEMDAAKLCRAFRLKNRPRYQKNKAFFYD